ncbi:MAG: hypothetical protein QF787_07030, partial [Nitrospinota bacterium]|nr:hypothetical protein [Nitrospinota bacterium]
MIEENQCRLLLLDNFRSGGVHFGIFSAASLTIFPVARLALALAEGAFFAFPAVGPAGEIEDGALEF